MNKVVLDDVFEGQAKQRVLTHPGKMVPIEEIDVGDLKNESEFDLAAFKRDHLENNRPLIVRNGLKGFDCGEAYSKWSLSYLKETCGANKVHVRRNTQKDEYKVGKAYRVDEVEFSTYVDDLVEGNMKSENSYLAVQNLKKAFPQIDSELRMPPIVPKNHAGPFLWIARAGHYEYTHLDPDDNLLTVFKGRKLVRLFGCGIENMHPNRLGSLGRTIQSQIDCDDPKKLDDLPDDVRKKFEQTTCHYCLLKESDMLFFPAFWWHQVKSPELTISVNVFFGDDGDNKYIAKILREPQREGLLYWIFNIIQQNLEYPSFPRVVLTLPGTIYNFLFKQWHEMLNDDQLADLCDCIIENFGLKDQLEELKKSDLASKHKNPPTLRIRGLLQRNSYGDKRWDKDDSIVVENQQQNKNKKRRTN